MAIQTTDNRLAQVSRSPSHSDKSGTATPIVVATCLLAALVALSLLSQRHVGIGDPPPGFDDNGAWIVGP